MTLRAKASKWVQIDESTKRYAIATRLNIYRRIFKIDTSKDSCWNQLSFGGVAHGNPSINVESGRNGVVFSWFVNLHPSACFCSKRSHIQHTHRVPTIWQQVVYTYRGSGRGKMSVICRLKCLSFQKKQYFFSYIFHQCVQSQTLTNSHSSSGGLFNYRGNIEKIFSLSIYLSLSLSLSLSLDLFHCSLWTHFHTISFNFVCLCFLVSYSLSLFKLHLSNIQTNHTHVHTNTRLWYLKWYKLSK